jgi:hypothetical protein
MTPYADDYHEAKLKEITDADIEAWADRYLKNIGTIRYSAEARYDFIQGAKAALNIEIKHNDN